MTYLNKLFLLKTSGALVISLSDKEDNLGLIKCYIVPSPATTSVMNLIRLTKGTAYTTNYHSSVLVPVTDKVVVTDLANDKITISSTFSFGLPLYTIYGWYSCFHATGGVVEDVNFDDFLNKLKRYINSSLKNYNMETTIYHLHEHAILKFTVFAEVLTLVFEKRKNPVNSIAYELKSDNPKTKYKNNAVDHKQAYKEICEYIDAVIDKYQKEDYVY